ncbi:hypothetical protein PAXINDRAFT_18572 [Paxillus involutus ATCC 200175]|uniref:Uncharacterized protein n=1 Tax=Paxillus involutus ATCC 200175 TaxID=664439 RepID=A0A0C9TKB9_PAXIN|nr:hypothetical protein PAXINDRAFT_18572 [Paxillus involutus ATCC 200175]
MSSEIQSILTSVQLNDYASGMAIVTFNRTTSRTLTVAVATAVGYDFILTFINEITTLQLPPLTVIISKEETLVLGIYVVHCSAYYEMSPFPIPYFLPDSKSTLITGPLCGEFECNGRRIPWQYHDTWASDNVCVYPFTKKLQSLMLIGKVILAILLVIYIPTLVLSITSAAYLTAQKFYVAVLAVADVKACVVGINNVPHVMTYGKVARLVIGTLLCILAVAKFVRQSLEMHKALKQWRSDRYMKLFVRESILYFIANLIFNIAIYLSISETLFIIMVINSCVFPFVLAPRFVLSVRDLYSHAVGEHVDTGFGAVSHVNTILFANPGDMPAGDTETARGEGSSEGAQIRSDDRGTGLGEEADGACA